MRAKVIGFFVLVFVCSSSAPILAEQRSDQPAPPKAHAESSPEKVNAAKMKLNSRREKDRIARPGGEANACVRRYLTENATPGYDANQLGMEACAVCAREIRDAADADIADARAKIADERFREAFLEARSNLAANCDLSEFATIAIKQKEAAVSERLPIAISCVEKHAMTFALATSESPENIAMAAFNKCRNVFRAAAEAGVSLAIGVPRHEKFVDALVEGSQRGAFQRAVTIVVEARARQRIETAKPPDDRGTVQRQNGSGI